jgi:hypothetical protein
VQSDRSAAGIALTYLDDRRQIAVGKPRGQPIFGAAIKVTSLETDTYPR